MSENNFPLIDQLFSPQKLLPEHFFAKKLILVFISSIKRKIQVGFLPCQTPTTTVRLTLKGCEVQNRGCWIKSEEWRVMCFMGYVNWYWRMLWFTFVSASILIWFPWSILCCAHESPTCTNVGEGSSCSFCYHMKIKSSSMFSLGWKFFQKWRF